MLFHRVWHAGVWHDLRGFNKEEGLVQAAQAVYENSNNAVLVNTQLQVS